MKNLISVLLLVCFVFTITVNAEEKYKCFTELYPELAEKHQVPLLKGFIIYNGSKYFVLSECKYLIEDKWILWIDRSSSSSDNKLDGFCDAAVMLMLINGQLAIKALRCSCAYAIVCSYCKQDNIDLKEFVH